MKNKLIETKPKKRLLLGVLYASVLVAAISFGTYFFIRYNQVNDKYHALQMTDDQKNQQYVAKIAKLYNVPKFETEKPTVAIISDLSKLPDTVVGKKFFEGAKKDDVVILYKNADLSIIYRPSDNKIIRTDNYSNALAATNTYKVAIIAPSDQQEAIVQKLQTSFGNVSIVNKTNPKTIVAQGIVVDASGTNAKAAQELADKLGLSVGQLPEGESKVDGATLIVVTASQPAP